MNQDYLRYLRLNSEISDLQHEIKMARLVTGSSSDKLEDKLIKLNLKREFVKRRIASMNPQEKWQHNNYYRGLHSTEEGHSVYNISNPWFIKKIIRVYNQIGVPNSWMDNIMSGAQNAIDQVGLNLQVEYHGTHSSVEDLIKRATHPNGKTRALKLGQLLYEEPYRKETSNGTPHADILIIKDHDPNEAGVIRGSHGIGSYKEGYVIVWENSKNSTIHEVRHLLGIPKNHGEDFMREYAEYYNIDSCVMWWEVPSDKFCGHCLDRLKYFWKGLEESTSMKYFK